jgi:hypothetical protein
MKIVITEQQLKRIISEQPDSRFPIYGMSNNERSDALSGKYDNKKKLSDNLDADDYVDIVSGLIDVVPGIGNLVSATIDVTHGVTYIVRFFYAKTFEDKATMAVMALITLGTAFIPEGGGNAMNLMAKGEIKMLLRQTPYELRVIAKNMGLIKSAGFQLAKQPWKYSLLIALVKIFRSQLDNVIGYWTGKLAYISNHSKELKPILVNFTKEMKDVIDIMEIKDAPINKSFPKPNNIT